jgi:hypothetical protein
MVDPVNVRRLLWVQKVRMTSSSALDILPLVTVTQLFAS